jgi:ketosteroid isomerase-like protein
MSRSDITKLSVVVVAILLIYGCQIPVGGAPSDEELIRATIIEWKAANIDKDIDRLMATISEDFVSFDGGGKESMRDFLNGAVNDGFMDNFRIDIKDAKIQIKGNKATFGPVEMTSDMGPFVFNHILQKDNGKWLIVGGEMPEM